jgi:hypothetical protein
MIAQRDPNVAIVRVLCQRLSVVQPPRANGALFERKLHVLHGRSVSVCALRKYGGRSSATPWSCATRYQTRGLAELAPPFADPQQVL